MASYTEMLRQITSDMKWCPPATFPLPSSGLVVVDPDGQVSKIDLNVCVS